MSALFYFDEKLSAERARDDCTRETIERQLEVYVFDGKLYLRVGPPPDDTKGEFPVRIKLSQKNFGLLRRGLRNAGKYVKYLA